MSTIKGKVREQLEDRVKQVGLVEVNVVSINPTMKEWEERLEIEIKKADYHFDNKNFDLPYEFLINNNADHKFMNKLLPYLKDVEEVYFAGGEIIITPEHYECLDYWIENGQAEQIELSYTTNFSVLKYKDKDLKAKE